MPYLFLSEALGDKIQPYGRPFKVYVFQVTHSLCRLINVVEASWDDVILDEQLKQNIRNDYTSFFKSEKTYRNLQVPWKRGVIFLGVSRVSLRCLTTGMAPKGSDC